MTALVMAHLIEQGKLDEAQVVADMQRRGFPVLLADLKSKLSKKTTPFQVLMNMMRDLSRGDLRYANQDAAQDPTAPAQHTVPGAILWRIVQTLEAADKGVEDNLQALYGMLTKNMHMFELHPDLQAACYQTTHGDHKVRQQQLERKRTQTKPSSCERKPSCARKPLCQKLRKQKPLKLRNMTERQQIREAMKRSMNSS